VISYQLPVNSDVTLKVYDVLGNEVATLVNEEQTAGEYEVEFNTSSSFRLVRNLTSGIYFYQLKAGDYIQTKKMILLK
jgi:5-hydroxyisourate hydrolase-like protein (transthyretin family)